LSAEPAGDCVVAHAPSRVDMRTHVPEPTRSLILGMTKYAISLT
jgi:hypothetical protein